MGYEKNRQIEADEAAAATAMRNRNICSRCHAPLITGVEITRRQCVGCHDSAGKD